jgi:hypothetical protein
VPDVGGVDVAQEEHEVVAAEAGDHVAVADRAGQGLGDRLERLVAARVAALLVDLLEAVHVDRDDAEAGAVRDRLLHLLAQVLVQAPVVGQTGHRIGRRELLEALALMAEERDGAVEGLGDLAELAGAERLDARVEVALLEAVQAAVERFERVERRVAQDPGDPAADARGERERDRDGRVPDDAVGVLDRGQDEAERRHEDEQTERDRDRDLDEQRLPAVGRARGCLLGAHAFVESVHRART